MDDIGDIQEVTLKFLPPNTTSLIQPCDQGIIRNLKYHYRNYIVKKIVKDIDDDDSTNHSEPAIQLSRKLTVLDAIHLLTRAWRDVTPTTIQNCFRKGGFSHPTADETNTADTDGTTTHPTPDNMTRDLPEIRGC